ncbi:diaminobutyrate acetyltransferase [Corticimicrobacter populi]|uniref:L-2,4-diaminobutyric acid acetyltransferase n=1 Tax=Corticimicrobacter populi TaxID=2175229 RepID=A0A2V1K3Y5_9BURK|nr:diaminobutyrate acetyltransferase [Corticimicrobacter populi]PWF23148.1 diaminobutyrate acetyltransferase [Corticimicrobacter populi]QDQ87800.1 diaminobutyrate acetyltransferase [Alcaligenaceae bacterium SJ-26]
MTGDGPILRSPRRADGAAIHRLVADCPPLDLNSTYAYLLLCEHFAATCVVAEDAQGLAGFISAYLPPDRPDTLFIWQVAVHERTRGTGLGGQMLLHLLARPGLRVQALETTVSPDNRASRRMFEKLAAAQGAALTEQVLFRAADFGGDFHEEECLLRIGPF